MKITDPITLNNNKKRIESTVTKLNIDSELIKLKYLYLSYSISHSAAKPLSNSNLFKKDLIMYNVDKKNEIKV